MGKVDLTGFENEYVKVLKLTDTIKDTHHTYYDIVCKRCGKVYSASSSNIRRVKSCGCLMKNKWRDTAESHIGEKYNKLTIIGVDYKRTEYERNKENPIADTFYFTKCDCGKYVETSARLSSLKCGHIKSCGCSKFNNDKILEDITGKTFGRLTVIERDIKRDRAEIEKNGTRSGNAHWLCKCNCGSEKIISTTGYALKSGGTQSCGCILSEILIERNKTLSTKYNHHGKLKDNKSIVDESGHIKIYDENDEFYFLISEEDFEDVSKYYWRKISDKTEDNPRKRYWITNEKYENINNGNRYSIRLHQLIATNKFNGYDKSKFVPDHLDRNPDNNTRENLYLKTNFENSHNRGLSRVNTSGKTGVYLRKDNGKWDACITYNYKTIYLGSFDKKEEAIEKRIIAEKELGFTCDDVFPEYDYKVL